MEDISFYKPEVDLIKAIREEMSETPILLVTPTDSPYAQALEISGARTPSEIIGNGNYVLLTIPANANGHGPFKRFQSFLSHIRMKLNSGPGKGSVAEIGRDQIRIKDLLIDIPKHEVFRSGERVELTLSEFKLLVEMASGNGIVLDYVTLVRKALGYETEKIEAKELIKRHIYALRRKIEPTPGKPRYILNVRGVGYRVAVA